MNEAHRARCWDKEWVYVPKDATDIRARFDKVRAELAAAKPSQPSTVRPLRKVTKDAK